MQFSSNPPRSNFFCHCSHLFLRQRRYCPYSLPVCCSFFGCLYIFLITIDPFISRAIGFSPKCFKSHNDYACTIRRHDANLSSQASVTTCQQLKTSSLYHLHHQQRGRKEVAKTATYATMVPEEDETLYASIGGESKKITKSIMAEWHQQYVELMKDIMTQSRSLNGFKVKNKKRKNRTLTKSEIQAVQSYLLSPLYTGTLRATEILQMPNMHIRKGTKNGSSDGCRDVLDISSYREQLMNCKHLFWGTGKELQRNLQHQELEQYQETDNEKGSNVTNNIPSSMNHHFHTEFTNPEIQSDYACCCLSYFGDVCAKKALPGPCVIAWYKLKECGIIPRENCVSTYMYVLSLTSTKVAQDLSTTDDNNLCTKQQQHWMGGEVTVPLSKFHEQQQTIITDACMEVATFHDLFYEPNEKTITLRIKTLISKGDAEAAEEVLSLLSDKKYVSSAAKEKNGDHNKRKFGRSSLMEQSDWKRLRTFLPIFSYYCSDSAAGCESNEGNQCTTACIAGSISHEQKTNSALRLFREMRESEGVHLDSETYTLLISALARRGYFFGRSAGHKGYDEKEEFDECKPFSISNLLENGSALFNYIASRMASDVLEIDEECSKTIYDAFMLGYSKAYGCRDSMPFRNSVDTVPRLQGNYAFPSTNGQSGVLIGRVSVDQVTSVCPGTGAKLQLFALSDSQREQVHSTLLQMAAQQHEEFGAKLLARRQNGVRRGDKKTVNTNDNIVGQRKDNQQNIFLKNDLEDRDGQYAYLELLKFSKWLREGCTRLDNDLNDIDKMAKPYTAIVDGPNVAYYGHGDVHYSQVQAVVDSLERLGEKPLVIMPQKYVEDKFWLALGFAQTLSDDEKRIRDQLLDKKRMYVVPTACLDDYYWMLASVAYTSKECKNAQIATESLPGLRPLIITNDQMRDHRFSLLEPRSFRRWTSCHVMNYNIEPYQKDEWEERKVAFVPADFFSREIQCNNVDVAHISDQAGLLNYSISAWHFPVSDWDNPDRFCICILA